MRIVHCSDWHLYSGLALADLRLKRLLGWLNWQLRRGRRHDFSLLERFLSRMRENPPDALVVTGDLCQLGDRATSSRAGEILDSLARETGLAGKILCLPGNHDRYVNDSSLAHLDELFARFGLDESGFSVHELAQARVALLREAAPSFYLSAAGKVPDAAWEKLSALDFGDKPGILAGHYPLLDRAGKRFGRLRRLDRDAELLDLIARLKPRFYLCGHIHEPFAQELPGGCLQLCPGALTMTGTWHEIEITPSGSAWRLASL